ncbi:MAG TPA: hypothetical protein PKA88_29715, partial [Polyangiaceae bacterium]|nr:hypothetical protein [Polyangiaceae bacterium]
GGATGGTGGGPNLPSCADTYCSIPGVGQVCAQTAVSCDLRYNATTASCAKICTDGGGVCINAYNNSGTCGRGSEIGCANSTFGSAICVCSRGCGSGPPCSGTQTCQSGTCS